MRRRCARAAAAALLCVVACRDDGRRQESQADAGPSRGAADRARTVVVGAAAEPRSLLPPFAIDLVAGQLCDLLYQRLADPSPNFSPFGDRDYRPGLSTAWVWAADSLSLRFTLDSAARWHDGRRVTSEDVRFTFELLRDATVPESRAPLAGLLDSVSAPDARTVVLWATHRSPTLFHELTYASYILPAHLLAGAPRAALARHRLNRAPVGSGPFRLIRRAPGATIQLGLAHAPRRSDSPRGVLYRIFPNYRASLAALEDGAVDVLDYVRPEDARRLAADSGVALLRLPGFSYAILQFNLLAPAGTVPGVNDSGTAPEPRAGGPSPRAVRNHPVLGDPAVRRALAMSVDRRALAQALLDSLGFVSGGPFTRAQATADTTVGLPPYDLAAARRLLEARGWRAPAGTPGGTRRRGGRPLELSLLVPSSSATRVRAAVMLQAMLARVGIRVIVDERESGAVIAALRTGAFDAALTALRIDPDPTGVREAWGGVAARGRRGFNFGGYASTTADSLLDEAGRAGDPAAARRAYRAAYQQIVNDVPAVFLYEPIALVAHRRRLSPVGVRADAWWAQLSRWVVR